MPSLTLKPTRTCRVFTRGDFSESPEWNVKKSS